MIYEHSTHVSEAANRQFNYISCSESGGRIRHTNDQYDGETFPPW